MYTCLYCNTITDNPVLVHVIDTEDDVKSINTIIPMCSVGCAKTLEQVHDCIIVDSR